jgi:hypothetical protein
MSENERANERNGKAQWPSLVPGLIRGTILISRMVIHRFISMQGMKGCVRRIRGREGRSSEVGFFWKVSLSGGSGGRSKCLNFDTAVGSRERLDSAID